jgi:hypothetical protein
MIPITSAEVYMWFFIHVGVLLVAAAWLTVSAILFPKVTERGAVILGSKPWRSFFIGLALFIIGIILFAVMNAIPFAGGKFIAVVIGLSVILLGLLGAGGLVRCLALRVYPKEMSHPARSMYGISLLVVLTWMLPLLGWFLALPTTLILGLGSIIQSRAPKKQYGTTEA